MKYLVVGLGNPDEGYTNTRHSVGREVVEAFRRANKFPEWEFNKKINALYTKGKLGKPVGRAGGHIVELVLPETFMNKSGSTVKKLVTSKKAAERMIVVHDDMDLPLGTLRILFARGSGGHKGVESVQRAVGTKNFARLRFGIALTTPAGKIKKPRGEQKVIDFVLKKFSKKEREVVDKEVQRAAQALGTFIQQGLQRAMNDFN